MNLTIQEINAGLSLLDKALRHSGMSVLNDVMFFQNKLQEEANKLQSKIKKVDGKKTKNE